MIYYTIGYRTATEAYYVGKTEISTLNTTTALIISMLEISVGKSYPRRWELKISNETGNGRPQFTCRLSTAMVVLMHVFLCYA